VIQGFAHRLEEGSRSSDIPCRFGGEEFAVILPDTDIAAAQDVAERYRASFESMIWAEHEDIRLTASFGVASIDGLPDRDPRTMIEAADHALYRAKQEGRNIVRVAEPASAVKPGRASKSSSASMPRSKSA
jgi:diguanylate cyclase (GGDEF)-like protein